MLAQPVARFCATGCTEFCATGCAAAGQKPLDFRPASPRFRLRYYCQNPDLWGTLPGMDFLQISAARVGTCESCGAKCCNCHLCVAAKGRLDVCGKCRKLEKEPYKPDGSIKP